MRAMILAAGRGERMRPLTDHIPKPLLKLGSDPLIVHHIRRCVQAGYADIIINCAYRKEQIKQALGDGSTWGARIQYSEEEQPLETLGGICQALPLLGEQPFLLLSADIWTDYGYGAIRLPAGRLAHLVLVDNPKHHLEGDFYLQADGQLSLSQGQPLTYSGIGIYHPRLFQDCQPKPARLAPLLKQRIDQISGEYYRGRWWDIGTPERYQRAQQAYGSRD